MTALQILSKVLATKSVAILQDNQLTEDYFIEYKDEYKYIMDHYNKYGNVPDEATFLSKFDIELVEVTESDSYLVDTIREEYLYYKGVPVVQKAAKLLKEDANMAAEYMIHAVNNLQPDYGIKGTDIIHQAQQRYDEYLDRKSHQDDWFFTTGFEEFDDLIKLQRGEELVVILARTNEGKSWVLEKICSHIFEIGFTPGYISPEMGEISVGYRFDTLIRHFSNKDLMWAKDDLDEKEYKEYIDKLEEKQNKFIVSTPKDFQNRITVSKIRNWIKQYKLDLVAIDGITYLTDERSDRNDNRAQQLTHISEDLMQLSVEMKVPVIVVAQANRMASFGEDDEESTPDVSTVQHSDGIGQNASKIIALRQLRKNNVLRLEIKKQRFGVVGKKVDYIWDINTGQFTYVPSSDDVPQSRRTKDKMDKIKKSFEGDKEEVF